MGGGIGQSRLCMLFLRSAHVGEVALNRWITDEEKVSRWVKRAIGDRDYRRNGKSAIEISAEILKVLKGMAEEELGGRTTIMPKGVTPATVLMDPYFNRYRTDQTLSPALPASKYEVRMRE